MRRPRKDGRQVVDPRVVKPLDKDEVHELMTYLLRCSLVISEARGVLEPKHFRKEPHLKVLLTVLYELLERDPYRYPENLVRFAPLYNAVRKRVEDDIDVLEEKHVDWLLMRPPYTTKGARNGVIFWAYRDVNPDDLDEQAGLDLLKRFLKERALMKGVEAMVNVVTTGGVLDNYVEFADSLRNTAVRIEAIATSPIRGIKPPPGALAPMGIRSTGVPFLDLMLGGGLAPPELVGIVGPTGGGKSTFCYQVALSMAKLYFDEMVVHLSFEDDYARMCRRAWSCGAMVHKASLEDVVDVEEAARSGLLSSLRYKVPLKPYEHDEAIQGGKKLIGSIRGEYERMLAMFKAFDNYLMVDMVGDGRGAGYVDEISAIIDRCLREKREYKKVSLVIIDSIDIVVNNHLEAMGLNPRDNASYYLQSVMRQLRRKVSTRFNTPIILVNQLAGENLKKAASVKMSLADAAGSKTWGFGLDFGLALGNTENKQRDDREDKEDACPVGILTCAKSRRAGTKGRSRLIRLRGDFGYWEDCSNDFTIEMGQIVPVRDVQLASSGPLARRTSASRFDDTPIRIS